MHYYQHHIGDFIKDTANLTDSQLATYLRMMWAYYDTEKPITGELEDIAFAMRSDEKTVRLLLRHYFIETPEGWRHARCDAEIQLFREKQDKAAKSANARWTNANAKRTRSDRNANEGVLDANQEPITNNQHNTLKPSAGKPARFNPRSIDLIGINVALQAAWSEWLDYRIKRARGMTEDGWRAQAADLTAWLEKGHDPLLIVRTSIKNGWQGLFEPKGVTQLDRSKAWADKLTGKDNDERVIEGTATPVH